MKPKLIPWPKVKRVDEFFPTITPNEIATYNAHWDTLAPLDYLETFQRWLFAFCSVHTTWEANVRGYNAIRPWFGWHQDPKELNRLLTESRIGLQHNRTKFITEFCGKFWKEPGWYYKQEHETWVQYRNRLVKNTLGLGPAKVSFALELMYPQEANVTCLDTHMFQFYGLDQSKHASQYQALERHWCGKARGHGVSPTVARAIFWDRKQKKKDSKYWTYVIDRNTE